MTAIAIAAAVLVAWGLLLAWALAGCEEDLWP